MRKNVLLVLKLLVVIFIFVGSVIPICSFAEEVEETEEAENLIVSDIKILHMKNNEIFGNFQIKNNSESYIPDVSYVINLIVEDDIEGESSLISINNIPAASIDLQPYEEKTIFFEYEIPEGLPQKQYFLYLRVSQKDICEEEWKTVTSLGELGKGNEYLKTNGRTIELLEEAVKAFNITLSPEIKKESQIKLSLNSHFEKVITATPKVKIYYPNIMSASPAITYDGDPITFEPGKDTEFDLKIPALNNAGQYLVKFAMFDGDKQVSHEFELSCFVNGKVASIADTTAQLIDGDDVSVLVTLLGNRVSSKTEEYELKYKIYNKATKELMDEDSKSVKLGDSSVYEAFAISKIGDNTLLVNLSLMDGKNILSSHNIELSKEKLMPKETATFVDVTSPTRRDAVLALADMGIINGYPDGTFRPENNITRAEFTVIATRLANAKITSEASAFSDVEETHWAKDFINTAYKKKYLAGYGNGVFKPDNPVTYQEAITILVNILGYPREEIEHARMEMFYKLSWPDNYILAARELGILNNCSIADLSKPAPRQDIAVLTLNAYFAK